MLLGDFKEPLSDIFQKLFVLYNRDLNMKLFVSQIKYEVFCLIAPLEEKPQFFVFVSL